MTNHPLKAPARRTARPIVSAVALLAGGLTAGFAGTRQSVDALQTLGIRAAAQSTVSATHQIHLPVVARSLRLDEPGKRVWGLQFQLEFAPEFHRQDVEMELPRAREAGVTSVRTNLHWEQVEPLDVTPAEYDWTVPDTMLAGYGAKGFDILVTIVGYPAWASKYRCGGGLLPGMEPDWREFVRAAGARYGTGWNVVAWEIGNEPDGTTRVDIDDYDRPPEWGQGEPTIPHGGCWGEIPGEYAAFLMAAAEELEAADPDGLVTYGGLAYQDWARSFNMDFIDGVLAAGAGPAIDFHNYHSFAHFWTMPGQPTGIGKHDSLIARLRRYGEETKPVWLTETYRATYDPDPTSVGLQVPFLTRDLVELLARPELERVYWYAWVDTPSDVGDGAQIGRGLIGPDRVPKPAFWILPRTIELTNGEPRDLSTGSVRLLEFQRKRSGYRGYAAWSTVGADEVRIPVPDGWSAHVTRFPVDEVVAGLCCPRQQLAVTAGHATVALTGDGTFVEVAASAGRSSGALLR
jgi:hypothetical protein